MYGDIRRYTEIRGDTGIYGDMRIYGDIRTYGGIRGYRIYGSPIPATMGKVLFQSPCSWWLCARSHHEHVMFSKGHHGEGAVPEPLLMVALIKPYMLMVAVRAQPP